MAYLHCHNCHWSQDDFWKFTLNLKSSRIFGYNPISILIENVRDYINPRWIKFDPEFVRYSKLPNKNNSIHSWIMIIYSLKRFFRKLRNQDVWTYKGWEKVKGQWKCPNCKSNNWDID